MKDHRQDTGNGKAVNLKRWMSSLPAAISTMFKNKTAVLSDSSELRKETVDLGWNEAAARTVISEIEELLRRSAAARSASAGEDYSAEDLQLAEAIAEETRLAGANNISRTAAYLACYQACPELHWAFLAHMVSRNAGWNMTDLQSSRMADAIDAEEKRLTYRFLERCNALIFQDAYPQLRLYMKSRELGASRFHLLPYFHVSRFMRPFWERFWIDRGSALLTVGLIINEQNYIEKRVVRHPYFQKQVTDKLNFRLFSLAGLNQIVFPLSEAAEGGDGAAGSKVRRLAGRTVSDFGSLQARIALGKSLYAMLMGYRAVRSGAERFAASVPHSGSRADYWPELFTANLEEALTAKVQGSELLAQETLPPGQRLYSPKLLSAWGDTAYEPISREDWLKDTRALDDISAPKAPFLCDISRSHRNGILTTAFVHDAVEEQ
ncbi:DUF2515 family protein [Paenibacillus barengoltzii]|uniref:DUF2515 domain-containing protein n=2 Tax=Paenibacillus barengoltzii TaxID=343517 RepID=R9LIX1_9BACL|nr:DUF2515 family protein [Paenibacillus barengoltzii]EOS58729.1 hypothetical protein C812_00333 [Paenibacillus barengoltzii G22]